MPSTLSTNPPRTRKAGVGRYGYRAAQWERERANGAQECGHCGRKHLSNIEAKVGLCWRCEDAEREKQASAIADLYTGEPPAEPSLAGMIANLEAARARIAKLDAMTDGEEPVEEAQAGTWDEGCKPWEFFCKGCGRTRPGDERVDAYVKRGCRIIATLEVCRDCGPQVSVCVRE